ncbi:MAG: hypothetical protein FWD68_11205 [Alphaproteobacteria bacterium]|nr:hypothetical protein [Alphaproteobacteria bacterium]
MQALGGALKPQHMRRVRHEKSGETGRFSKKFLQDLIHDEPGPLQAEELDRSFAGLKPVCRDLGLATGSIDNLLVNRDGHICIVACRFWHNPEALRTVVGEVLDSAEALAGLTYSEFEAAAAEAAKSDRDDFLAWTVLGEEAPDEDDKEAFRDAVTLALEQGAFLVLVVGEGIRAGLRQILDFRDRSLLRFQFGLVEIALYQAADGGRYVVQPRLLLATETVTRTLFVVEKEGQLATKKISAPERSATILEQEFYEKLGSRNPAYPDRVRKLIEAAQEVGCAPELLKRYNIYASDADHSLTLVNIASNGTVAIWGMAARDDKIGKEIGTNYMKRVVDLLPSGRGEINDSFDKKHNWYVRFDGKSSIPLDLLLAKEKEWLEAMREVVNALTAVGYSGG